MAKRAWRIKPSPAAIRAMPPGRHFDGNGLYLQITAPREHKQHFRALKQRLRDGAISREHFDAEIRKHSDSFYRSWLFMYKPPARKLRSMGLGSWPKLLPSQAHILTREQQRIRAQGKDPITEWRRKRKSGPIVEDQEQDEPTFKRMAEHYMSKPLPKWNVWRKQFETYVFNHPAIANVPFYDLTARSIAKIADQP